MSKCNTCPSKSNCSSTAETCGIENNPLNNIKKVIGVMSGKGGVGKSTISAIVAKELNKLGYKVGVLDSDITGPSIPRLLGVQSERASSDGKMLYPVTTEDGIKVISYNLLTEDENQPVIWRGPIVSSAVKQFWTDVLWGDLDYLVIDMPPGTGDVALTVMDSIPINGLVMVSIPQDMVSMIVAKAVNMAKRMDIRVLGVVQNMSYILCPGCNEVIRMYDAENIDGFLKDLDLKLLGEMPMMKDVGNLSFSGYKGSSENIDKYFKPIMEEILNSLEER